MIVFAGDLHLTPKTWTTIPDLEGDAYCALNQITDYCLLQRRQKGQDVHLILGGDVFDRRRPDSESVTRLMRAAEVMHKDGIHIVAIQGQHDWAEPPWTVIGDYVHYIGDGDPDQARVFDGFEIRGYDNLSATMLQQKLEEDAKGEPYDILVLHQLARKAIPFEGAWDFDEEWIPPFVKLVLMGDLHKPIDYEAPGGATVAYSGATHMRKIDETDPKSFIVVTEKDGMPVIERIPLHSRDVLDVVIVDDESMTAASEKIMGYKFDNGKPEEIRRPIVLARFNEVVPDVKTRLRQICAPAEGEAAWEGCFLLERPITSGVEVVDAEQPKIEGEVSLSSCLASVVDPEQDKELYSFVLALLQPGAETTDVLAATRQHMGVS